MENKEYGKIAVIRIRGSIKLKKELKDTFNMLKLYKQHNCVILNATPSIMGMLKKIASYVTWGEIDNETLNLLKEKREEKTKDKKGREITKKFFRLHPPRKGFERKGIKLPFKVGGALGYRGEKINDLIKKMIPPELVPNLQAKKTNNKEGRA
ncbi:50S ribosomal protein L30 [Candidatus Woesearchaeota archaeon]|nr:50S ribosomal protein L30 [Candidatus Woesearchaeota archaeon]